MRLVPRARAASSRARLVMDFEPGGTTRPRKGAVGGMIVVSSSLRLIANAINQSQCQGA